MTSIPYKTVRVGDTFGRWTVIENAPIFRLRIDGGRVASFTCRCQCGTERVVGLRHLRSGASGSCGCLRNEIVHISNGKHWDKKNPLYGVWCHMRRRCHNPADPAYSRYGGRGIGVCAEWRDSFIAFRDWAITHGYERHLDLDRRDNNLGYNPDNCRFTTRTENNNNRRDNVILDAFGERKTKAQWARDPRCVVVLTCLGYRIQCGWEPERALSTPSRRTGP